MLTLAANRMAECFDEATGDTYLEIVKRLGEAGADVNASGPNRWTALDFAEYNPMKGHGDYDSRWFGKGAEYLRRVGARRGEGASRNQ